MPIGLEGPSDPRPCAGGGSRFSSGSEAEFFENTRRVLADLRRSGEPSAKLETLLDHIESIAEEGHKALIFSQFTSLLSIVCERLTEAGIRYEYLDGRTKDRQARVERFQSDEACPVFVISLKVGGVGLNLTRRIMCFCWIRGGIRQWRRRPLIARTAYASSVRSSRIG